jgi:hypothetical protein
MRLGGENASRLGSAETGEVSRLASLLASSLLASKLFNQREE